MSHRPATRDDHEAFVRTEEWELVRRATGGAVRHHATYTLALPDGRILRTRISRPVDATTYGTNLWARILRDQLDVTNDEFWSCVTDGELPDRGTMVAPSGALPAGLVFALIQHAGYTEAQVAAMSKDEAVAAMNAHWTGSAG